MAIGYEQAKNLMKQLDWKAKVTMVNGNLNSMELYHPLRPKTYRPRLDSGRRLMKELRIIKRENADTGIYCYDHEYANEDLI